MDKYPETRQLLDSLEELVLEKGGSMRVMHSNGGALPLAAAHLILDGKELVVSVTPTDL